MPCGNKKRKPSSWKPITVAGQFFKYKGEFKNKLREIRDKWRPVTKGLFRYISKTSDDHTLLLHAMKLHHNPEKNQAIVDFFAVKKNGAGYCFYFMPVGGTEIEDVSFHKMADGADGGDPHSALYKALRAEISDQTMAYRANFFAIHRAVRMPAPCLLSGATIDEYTCEVDHHPRSFKELADQFVTQEKLDASTVSLIERDVGNFPQLALKDRALAQKWKRYHMANAGLRVLSTQEHKHLPKRD